MVTVKKERGGNSTEGHVARHATRRLWRARGTRLRASNDARFIRSDPNFLIADVVSSTYSVIADRSPQRVRH